MNPIVSNLGRFCFFIGPLAKYCSYPRADRQSEPQQGENRYAKTPRNDWKRRFALKPPLVDIVLLPSGPARRSKRFPIRRSREVRNRSWDSMNGDHNPYLPRGGMNLWFFPRVIWGAFGSRARFAKPCRDSRVRPSNDSCLTLV